MFNNTRVIPARLSGTKESGGKVEVLIERILDPHRVIAHVRANKSPKAGGVMLLEGAIKAEVVARHDTLFEIVFLQSEPVYELLEEFGHIPLHPISNVQTQKPIKNVIKLFLPKKQVQSQHPLPVYILQTNCCRP